MNIILTTIIASILGLIVFLVHSYFLNQYLRTKNNLALALMLPLITAIITKTISTNLFLSLGMIGALSIVRYRTPVKSTYELTLLFALVTIGISSIVNIKYSKQTIIEKPYLKEGVDLDYLRWLYTAVTRAEIKLYLIGF